MTTTAADRTAFDAYGVVLSATEQGLDRVAAFAALADEVERGLRANVYAARQQGYSWQAIGDALGVSRQAAQQRYGE